MQVNNNIHITKNLRIKQNETNTNEQKVDNTKDFTNSPNPAEFIGRSQVIFRGRNTNKTEDKEPLPELRKEDLKPIKFVKNKPISKKEAIEFLKELSYTDDDISKIDLDNPVLQKNISGLKQYLDIDDFKTEREEAINEFKTYSPEEKLQFIDENLQNSDWSFFNQKNYDALKKYINFDIDDSYELLSRITDADNRDIFLEKLPLIYLAKGNLEKHDAFDMLRASNLEGLSYYNANAIRKINNVLNPEQKLSPLKFKFIGDDKDLSEENVNKYIEQLKDFKDNKKVDISTFTNFDSPELSLKNFSKSMSQIDSVLNEYPIDLSTSDDKQKITKTEIENFINRDDIKSVQEYVNSLTPESKKLGIKYMPTSDNTELMSDIANICNIISQNDYGDVDTDKLFEFLYTKSKENGFDIKGITKLIELNKGTNNLKYNPDDISVSNNNYKEALRSYDLKSEFKKNNLAFNDYLFHQIVHNGEGDIKNYNKVLKYIKDNNVDTYNLPYEFYQDSNGYNKTVLYEKIAKPSGLSGEYKTNLFKIADTVKNDEELNYALELFAQRRYPESDGDYSSRFNGDFIGINNIIKSYQNDKETTKYVVNLKDKNNNWRMRDADSIISVVESLHFDKDFTETLLALKNKKGSYRFYNGNNLYSLVKVGQKDKDYTIELLNKQDEFDDRGSSRFDIDVIPGLIDCAQIDKDFTNYLINLKYTNEYNQNQYRIDDDEFAKYLVKLPKSKRDFAVALLNMEETQYDGSKYSKFSNRQIKKILDNPPENKEFLLDIINKKEDKYGSIRNIYNSIEIENLAEAAAIDLNLTKYLINAKIKEKNYKNQIEYYTRFSSTFDIKEIVKASEIDKDFTQKLLNSTMVNYDGNVRPKYNADSIVQFLNLRKDYPKEDIIKFMNLKVPSQFNNNERLRFESPYDIRQLLESEKKNKPLFDELLNKNIRYSDNREFPMYGSGDIKNIIEANEIDSEYTTTLLNENDKNLFHINLNGGEILTLTQCAQVDKHLTDNLRNIKAKDKKGNLTRRFNAYDIRNLVNHEFKDKEYLLELANMQKSNNTDFRFNAQNLTILLKTSDEYGKDYVNELLALKNPENENSELDATEINDVAENVSYKDFKDLKNKIGDVINLLNGTGIIAASQFKYLYQVENLNEISIAGKKEMLKDLISTNADLLGLSPKIKEYYPLIPTTAEEYCSILPDIVKSIGIETNDLSNDKINEFNKTLYNLSNTLKDMDNNEFDELEISQEYSKNEFINDVLDKIDNSTLSNTEKQKVFDYYGFELHKNPNNETGYAIVGYPVNLNNGKKLAEIKNPKTQKVIEDLRKNVIKFSENNKIHSNNKSIEELINNLVDTLPELRTNINKKGDDDINYDLLKQSLKVIQKISQSDKFEKLNSSDKKILLLSALMQNIAKAEGFKDITNPNESSFDTHFITKKFKLSKEEQIKLYTMIKNQNWIDNINSKDLNAEKTKAMQSVAFDLQQNNNFELETILTKANIESLKETSITKNNLEETYDSSIAKIDDYINELKKSQPLLPVTKMPKTSEIEKHITFVNDDGSTNIKGVYKDKSGLVVVKFNEVENWEQLGFPKGSKSRGIKAKAIDNIDRKQVETETETGNIKFFVHGLDYANQLAKFDAFALPNSDALLSVSYAERPETKYRFFRPQGIILDVPADYVYGGGNTDAGSGCGKSIDNFKDGYIFDGYRESDRKYISDLIKEETGMSDEEYVKFYKKNKDKQMTEIQPKELQEKIIKKLATINSNHRKGNRSYNEMYISNPKTVMGVFAYEMNEEKNIEKPLEFLEENNLRTEFLKDYALKNDVPFYIFGD